MKKFVGAFLDYFSDEEDPREPHYDPAHIGAMIVLVLLALSVIFWLLWSLLVYGGGIQAKIGPLLSVLFTPKTAADFGYVGYPYEMGVFEGWVTNAAALFLLAAAVTGVWYVFNKRAGSNDKEQQR